MFASCVSSRRCRKSRWGRSAVCACANATFYLSTNSLVTSTMWCHLRDSPKPQDGNPMQKPSRVLQRRDFPGPQLNHSISTELTFRVIPGLVPRPFDLTWFYTNRTGESEKWSERAWRHHSTTISNYLQRTELWGVFGYICLSQYRVFLKESHYMWTYCSLNLKLIRVVISLTGSLSITLHHKFCPTCLVPHIKLISFPLNSSFCANPAQTRGVEILTGLTWELCMERGLRALSQLRSLATLFPFCHFHFHLSAHVHNWEPDSRPRYSHSQSIKIALNPVQYRAREFAFSAFQIPLRDGWWTMNPRPVTIPRFTVLPEANMRNPEHFQV